MSELARSEKLFAGCFVFIALEASGTSDLVTKPIASSPLWLQLMCVDRWKHTPIKVTEAYDCPSADFGWEEKEDEYTVADTFEAESRFTTSLHEQLFYGLAGAIVPGTPQTVFAKSDRSVRAWVKVQDRYQVGSDRSLMDFFAKINAMDPPEATKATRKPVLKLRHIPSLLRAINFPVAA